ncbi:MAG TPA: hypothetical protein DCX06_05255 [Opitutae bacterium]|nr:hypothetical protein [Opitutae bacterium]
MSPSSSEARIGERREEIERRLTGSGGIIYRNDETEQARRKGMPYMQYMELLGSSADVRIYFKTADGRRPTTSELESKRMNTGWDLHVVYVNGKSVAEVYKRSQAMSEYELNQLIAMQGGGSGWKKLGKGAAEESAFGYEMESGDGSVRAKKLGGDSILFVDAKVDSALAEMNTNDLLEKAPLSVNGF